MAELHKLFSAFLELCEPLFDSGSHATGSSAITYQSYSTDPPTMLLQPNPAIDTSNLVGERLPLSSYSRSDGSNLPLAGVDELQDHSAFYNQPGEVPSSSDNELMWRLLQSQPWLGWMNFET